MRRHGVVLKTFFIIVPTWLFLMAPPVFAARVAVFPVEDITEGINGVHFAITRQLEAELVRKGFEVVAEGKVLDYMVRKRIRRLGYMASHDLFQAAQGLMADYFLLGTVGETGGEKSMTIGVTLFLVRATDAKTVWANSEVMDTLSRRRILGLWEPENPEEFFALVTEKALADLSLAAVESKTVIPEERRYNVEIISSRLTPEYCRAREQIEASVHLRYNGDDTLALIYLDIENHGQIIMEEIEDGYYQAFWPASEEDGVFPVTLIVERESGVSGYTLLGSYQVDNKPPELDLVLKGKEVNDLLSFKKKLIIIPQTVGRDKIAYWQISVENEDGDVLIKQNGEEKMPTRFAWKGNNHTGGRAASGQYQVVFFARDFAGNEARTTRQVHLFRTVPKVIVEAALILDSVTLDLDYNSEVPLDHWRFSAEDHNGELLWDEQGESLPATIQLELSEPDFEEKTVSCIIEYKDILGNKGSKEISDLFAFARQEDNELPVVEENVWEEEF